VHLSAWQDLVCYTQRLPTAVASDASGAALVWRAVRIVDRDGALGAALDKGLAIERVNLLTGERLLQHDPCLGELAAHDAHAGS